MERTAQKNEKKNSWDIQGHRHSDELTSLLTKIRGGGIKR
jgi:hypothetical protein